MVIEPPGRTSLQSTYRIERGTDLIAEAALTHVCVNAETFDKQPWPDWFYARLVAAGV